MAAPGEVHGEAGQQTALTTPAGTFALQAGGTVVYTPAAGFSGTATATYVVRDAKSDVSNEATISVNVAPDPNAALKLFSFETGTEGWASASWQTNAGTVAQSPDFSTDGASSLEVTTVGGGWFGLVFPADVDLSGRTTLKFDLRTTTVGTSRNVALQVGSGFTWCESTWGFINANTTEAVEIDLLALGCGITDLSVVQSMYVWFSGGGVFYLDNVRAE